MSLIAQAKKDIEQITSNKDEFGVEITLIAPTGETLNVVGLHSKIHLAVDTDGNMVNSKRAHVSFSEKFLTDANYPCRNSSGEIKLSNHKINVKDSTGIEKKYIVQSIFPDETIGLITCIIGDFE